MKLLDLAISVTFIRLGRDRCKSCGKRRVLYLLSGVVYGTNASGQSPAVCGPCAGVRP